MENPDGASGFTQVGSNIAQGNGLANHIVPLHSWAQQAYLKSSNSEANDEFGGFGAIDVSDDGDVIAVGALKDDSAEIGLSGNGGDDGAADAGSAYIFTRSGSTWLQSKYIKASNAEIGG